MPDPSKYTISWICALPVEYDAAQALLDEEHNDPQEMSPHDNNLYTLGRIRWHNIVIVAPPNGKYGLSSTTDVIKSLLDSFPNIRISLLVGIGGGAPSRKHDIRLGDVVVGLLNDEDLTVEELSDEELSDEESSDGEGGVIQYDFDKAMQSQELHETGTNQAPALFRAAVNALRGEIQWRGYDMGDLSSLFVRRSRPLNHKRPEAASDRLYRSSIIHPAKGEAECSMICGNGSSSLIERHDRGRYDNKPEIHYGLIASANTPMKDAFVRDKLIEQKDVLCFETEAAGLMNDLPCLLIRGICDYSDSHGNTEWQGYAAMTAAAYARQLLGQIAQTVVEAQQRSNVILG